jgi:acetyl esterase/lipase
MRIDHALHPQDRAPAQANREARAATKGQPLGVEARPGFDAKKRAIPAAANVGVGASVVGGVPGFWCRPVAARAPGCVLFLHGGGYVLGSAQAFTNFAGQIAARVGVDTFVPDYRLAPEHPFPAALEDALAAYDALAAHRRVAVVGDSAGGGLALALSSALVQRGREAAPRPAAIAVMSPWTDLTLSGDSYRTRAHADPVFTIEVLRDIARTYLAGRPAHDPMASPLFGRFDGLPPLRIDVGEDELVLDDSIRYATQAARAGVAAEVHVWKGMPHVFQTGIGRYMASEKCLDASAAFLRKHLAATGVPERG